MATIYWQGKAPAVAQVSTATPANVEIGDVFRLLINSEVIASFTATAATVANVTAGLVAAWALSDSPYAENITATDGTTLVNLTSTIPGLPFTVTSSATDGGGANTQTLTIATPTASSGPNYWSVAANWSGGAVPVNSDIVVIKDSAVDICHGLDQSAVTLTGLYIEKTYTGRIGLRWNQVATSADARSMNAGRTEYRETYLKIGATNLRIGEKFGTGSPAGSDRIKINLGTVVSTIEVYGSARTPAETGLEAIRIITVNSGTIVYVRDGSCGIARDIPGEVSTISALKMTGGKASAGSGTTITTWTQNAGEGKLNAAATVTTITCNGGALLTEGDWLATTVNANGGTVTASNYASGSSPVIMGTLNLNGGTVDTTGNQRPRTISTVAYTAGTLIAEGGVLTVSAVTVPSSKKYSLVCAAV